MNNCLNRLVDDCVSLKSVDSVIMRIFYLTVFILIVLSLVLNVGGQNGGKKRRRGGGGGGMNWSQFGQKMGMDWAKTGNNAGHAAADFMMGKAKDCSSGSC